MESAAAGNVLAAALNAGLTSANIDATRIAGIAMQLAVSRCI